MGALLRDIRYAWRGFLRTPGVALLAILILAVGIGANVAIFSVVNAVVLRPLPYPEPQRLVWVTQVLRGNTTDEVTLTPDFLEWRARNHAFAYLAAFNPGTRNLTGAGDPMPLNAAKASSALLPALGVQPILGRNFTREEDQRGRDHVTLLSYGLWQRAFGADPSVLGRNVALDGEAFTVVGVLPADFRFPSLDEVELFTPLGKNEAQELRRGDEITIVRNVIGRIRPDVSLAAAKAELEAIQAGIHPPSSMPHLRVSVKVLPLHEHLLGNVRGAALALLGAVGFLLLMACVNVANLLLARAAGREREFAIRAALGGSRGRLMLQLLTESLALAVVSCAAGLLMARWARGLLVALNPIHLAGMADFRFDGRVLAFTAVSGLATAVVFGLAPAIAGTRISLNESLKSAASSVAGGRRQKRLLNALAAAEIALALILLSGAGLMLQSFWHMRYEHLGFAPDRLLTASMPLGPSRYPDRARQVAFLERILERLGSLPGVEEAALADAEKLPPGGGLPTNSFAIEGRPEPPRDHRPVAEHPSVSAGYFHLMRIPLVEGRIFTGREPEPVVMVNRTFAQRYFPGEEVLGKRIRTGGVPNPWRTIIGVVGDVKTNGLAGGREPQIYHPYGETGLSEVGLLLRTALDPAIVAGALRKEIARLDPEQPVAAIQSMDDRLTRSVAGPRFAAVMLGIFAALALLLVSVGIYGVMGCVVRWQTREIGIRRALGAQPRDVLGMLFAEAARTIGLGVAAGLIGSVLLTRSLTGLLFEVRAMDPLTLAAVSLLLSAVALAACSVPARRALQVDPTAALHYE